MVNELKLEYDEGDLREIERELSSAVVKVSKPQSFDLPTK
jgi:hypothetical protein